MAKKQTEANTLDRTQDLSMFCGPQPCRYALGSVKYHGKRRQLEAADGRIIAVVGADLGPEDLCIDGSSLQRAFSENNNDGGHGPVSVNREAKQIVVPLGGGLPLGEQNGRWPKTADLLGRYEPTVNVALKVDSLERILQYAKATGEEVVLFGFSVDNDKPNGHRFAVGPVRGCVMPTSAAEGDCPELTDAIWEEPSEEA